MPGSPILFDAQVKCAHSGSATATSPNPKVTIGGTPTVLLNATYMIAGCPFPSPPNGNGPCVSGQWLTGATRVLSGGQPLVISTSSSICTPTGTPMTAAPAKPGVTAT